jgi:MerR family transcriptional regulator, copper efflux regulator
MEVISIKPLMRSQVAEQSGLDIETVRFYERQGLIDEPPRSASGYRQYSQEDVVRLRFIKRAKELGFSLKEISTLLELQEAPDASSADVRAQAEAKIADIDEKIRDLVGMKEALHKLTKACPGQGTTDVCPIMEALTEKEMSYGNKT